MSIFTQKQERAEQRRIWNAQQLCNECGQPRSVTKSGAGSVLCESHRDAHAMRSKKARPTQVDAEFDDDGVEREFECVKAYAEKIKAIIKRADTSTDANYKGISIGEIHRLLGKHVDTNRTAAALNWLTLYEANLIPERYSLKPPPVRFVEQEKWGMVATPASYQFDPHLYPERANYGRRD